MKKLISQKEYEALFEKENRTLNKNFFLIKILGMYISDLTVEEKESLKYREKLLKIKKNGPKNYIRTETKKAFREIVIYLPSIVSSFMILLFFIINGRSTIGYLKNEIENDGEELLIVSGVLLLMLFLGFFIRYLNIRKTAKVDYKRYLSFLENEEGPSAHYQSKIDILFNSSDSSDSSDWYTVLMGIIMIIGVVVFGILLFFIGFHWVFLTNDVDNYVFPANILYMGMSFAMMIGGISIITYVVKEIISSIKGK